VKRFIVAVLMLASTSASAQTVENDLVGLGMKPEVASYLAGIIPAGAALDNNVFLKSDNAAGSATINVLKVDGSDDTILNADTGDVVKVAVATTPEVQVSDDAITYIGNTGLVVAPTAVAIAPGSATTPVATFDNLGISFTSAGQGVKLPSYVPTMAATPAAGTNDLKVGLNVVPTAAADTAALLKATPVVGDEYHIYNSGPNTVRVKAGGAATINGATAGGYVALPTLRSLACKTTAAANHVCILDVNPTPAGP
jgi:hypothetical protein